MENLNIKEKTNLELKEGIISSNYKQLKYIQESSFLTVFYSILEIKEIMRNSEELDNIRNTSEFRNINNYLNEILDLIKDIVQSGLGEVKQEKIIKLHNTKKELYNYFSVVEGYYRELNYIMMTIDHYSSRIIAERDYKDSEYDKTEILELIKFISEKLEKARNDYKKYTNIISLVISVLPMRLVKENYYNVLKNSIIRNFYNSPRAYFEKSIREYKKIFDSSMFDGYGTKFDYYFREIQNLRNRDYSTMDYEELDNVMNSSLALTEELLFLKSLLMKLGITINKLIVISLIGEDLDSDDIEDIYYDWKELIAKNSFDEKLNDRIKKEIDDIEKNMFDELEVFYALNNEALERKDFDYEELQPILLKTKDVLTYFNDIAFDTEETPSLGDEGMVTPDFLEQASNSLIEYINRAITGMSSIERKIRMKNLLASIDLPFNGIGEFFDYIEYSLDITVTPKEIVNMLIDYIYYMLDEI